MQGQAFPSPTKVTRAPSLQPRSVSAAKAKDSSGRAAEPPLEVMPISVWSPPARSASLLFRYRKTRGGSASELMEMRIPCFPMRSLLLARSHPSLGILISRGRMPCLLRRLWLYHSRGSPSQVPVSLFV